MKSFFVFWFAFMLLIFYSSTKAQENPTPVVVVTSPTQVSVNGVQRGKPCDVVANEPTLAPAMQAALEAWAAQVQAERDAAVQALQAKEGRISTVLATLLEREKKTAPNGTTVQLLEELKVEAAKPAERVKLETLDAEIARLQAEKAKLTPP